MGHHGTRRELLWKNERSWVLFWAPSTDWEEQQLIMNGLRMQGTVMKLPQQTHVAQLRSKMGKLTSGGVMCRQRKCGLGGRYDWRPRGRCGRKREELHRFGLTAKVDSRPFRFISGTQNARLQETRPCWKQLFTHQRHTVSMAHCMWGDHGARRVRARKVFLWENHDQSSSSCRRVHLQIEECRWSGSRACVRLRCGLQGLAVKHPQSEGNWGLWFKTT